MIKIIYLSLLLLLSPFSYAGSSSIKTNLQKIEKVDSKTYILTFYNPNYKNDKGFMACKTFKLTVSYSYKSYIKNKITGINPFGNPVKFPNHGTFVKNMEKLQKEIGKDMKMELIGSSYWEKISPCHFQTKAIALNESGWIVPMIYQN